MEPDTSALTEQQLRDAPALTISPDLIDLGDVRPGEKARKVTFRIRNEGKTEAHLSRICIPGSKALKIKQMPRRIAPGAAHDVKAEIIAGELPQGPFALEIQVVSDDPLHPSRTVRLVGIKR